MTVTVKYILNPFAFFFFLITAKHAYSQDETDNTAEYLSWGILQAIPSPVFFQDANNSYERVQFGFRWQLTPLNISFNANRYISPSSFLKSILSGGLPVHLNYFYSPELALSNQPATGIASDTPFSEKVKILSA